MERILTVPNSVTLFRALMLIPFSALLFTGHFTAAAGIFAAVVALDKLDGYLARRLNQESKIGSIMDSVTDWVLNVIAMAGITYFSLLSVVWIALVWALGISLTLVKFAFVRSGRIESSLPERMSGKAVLVMIYVTAVWTLLRMPHADLVAAALVLIGGAAIVDILRSVPSDRRLKDK